MKPIAHFRTITEHRHLVCLYCLRLGLIWQGLTHDLSKYSPEEFWRGAKYYQGFRSPNDAERMENGVSQAWLHHKGRNRHHFEYWVDYIVMFCDRLAACRIYLKDRYTDAAAYEYFMRSRDEIPIHPETAAELEKMLKVLKDEGEDAAFRYVRRRLKESR